MNRTPEPELMLGEEQARQYAEADFAEPHDHFITLLSDRLPGLADRGVALDLGCGPGDVTLRFARALPGWSVDGVDGSPAMLAFAHAALARGAAASRVRFAHAHLPADSPPRDAYDLVYSNSLLHHLEDPNVLWSSVARHVRPGGAVFVMDLMRPPSRQAAHSLVDRHSACWPEVLRTDFFQSLLAAYRPEEVRDQLAHSALAHLQVEPVSDRHLIVWGAARP